MSWNQVNCQWVVLGCPFQVFTFCNGTYHLQLDEFLLKPVAGTGVEQCDPQRHHRIEAVPSEEGEQYLDRILQQLKEEEK